MYKINENLQRARSILRRNNIPEDNIEFVKLRSLLSRNAGYLGKFTEWLFIDKISYDRLEKLYNSIKGSRLSKPINDFNTPEEIIDSMIRVDADTAINQIIKSIPSGARLFLMFGDDEYECEDCRNFTCDECKRNIKPEWLDIVRLLKQNIDKKEEIIDFLSKKGGRYNYDLGDYDFVTDSFKMNLLRIISPIEVDVIKAKIETDKNIKFIYEDDKYLIVAVDYNGVRKYGSSFWCIAQDESTFEDYIASSAFPCQQWICYNKNKKLFVDERSVMGITYNFIDKVVEAAHWEDDDECLSDAISIVRNKPLQEDNILNALDLYKKFIDKDEKKFIFDESWLLKKLNKNDIEILEMISFFYSDYDITNDNFIFNKLKKVLKENNLKLRLPKNEIRDILEDFLVSIIQTGLYEYLDFKNDIDLINDLDISFLLNNLKLDSKANLSSDLSFKAFNFFISKGYKLKLNNLHNPNQLAGLIKMNIISLDNIDISKLKPDYVKKIGDDAYDYLLSNEIYNDSYPLLLKFVNRSKKNFKKYKDNIISIINKITNVSDISLTLDTFDDDDIEILCIQKMHKKMSKYNIARRVLEKIKNFNDFNETFKKI